MTRASERVCCLQLDWINASIQAAGTAKTRTACELKTMAKSLLADWKSGKICFLSLGFIPALQQQKTALAPRFSHPRLWKSDMKFLKQAN